MQEGEQEWGKHTDRFREAVEFENIMTLEDAARAMQPRLPYWPRFARIRWWICIRRRGSMRSLCGLFHEEGKGFMYARSAFFYRAMKRLYPDSDVLIDHSLGDALYCQLVGPPFLERRD